jgi:probable DNA metabolism protein
MGGRGQGELFEPAGAVLPALLPAVPPAGPPAVPPAWEETLNGALQAQQAQRAQRAQRAQQELQAQRAQRAQQELRELQAQQELRQLSIEAWDDACAAALNEIPFPGALDEEIGRFVRRVIAAGRSAPPNTQAARIAAEQARTDRGDPGVRAVQEAAYQVRHELDRMMGFLRFSPQDGPDYPKGLYLARCTPDHFVLPALAEHFRLRFGDEIPWAIVDEKRGLALIRDGEGDPRLIPAALPPAALPPAGPGRDGWEELWRTYHRAVNNEARGNPALQRRLMPVRYWKYLNEL